MLQRYIKHLSAAVLLCFAVASCTKNLEQKPVSQVSRDAVFGSPEGLALYSNSFYNIFPDINTLFRIDPALSDYGAVNAIPTFLQSSYGAAEGSGWTWGNLRNLNYFIQNNTNPNVQASTRNNYMGLAKFFRAYFYFMMVQRFGDVPWINKPLDVSDTTVLYAKRDPRTLIMDSVLADINFAIRNIAATNDNTRSTVTKWVAYGMKSRICLFEGTFRKYQTTYGLGGTANKWLQDAADAAKAVMDSSGFSLNGATSVGPSADSMAYRNLFTSATPLTNEIMLANVPSPTLGKYNDANWYYTSATYGPRFSFIRTFINTYLNIDGTPFTDIPGHDTITFVNEVKNRDWRLQQTIRTGNYKRISGGKLVPAPPVFSYTFTGYQPIKWTLDDMINDNGATNTNSICLMRYAEILLNYAEAKAELGTMLDDDWAKTIGALRRRAGITGGVNSKPTVVDPYLKSHYFPDINDPVILEVRRERGIELALEGFRFYDLVRWKHGELLLNQWNGFYVPSLNTLMDLNGDGAPDVCFYNTANPPGKVNGVTYVKLSGSLTLSNGTYGELHWLDNVPRRWEEYMYLYPIPSNSLELNSNLGQNPGWQ